MIKSALLMPASQVRLGTMLLPVKIDAFVSHTETSESNGV